MRERLRQEQGLAVGHQAALAASGLAMRRIRGLLHIARSKLPMWLLDVARTEGGLHTVFIA